MNLSDVWTIFRKDWLQTLRDKNTLIIMLVGVLTLPVASTIAAVAVQKYGKSIETREVRLAVYGDDAKWALAELPAARKVRYELEDPKLSQSEAIADATGRGAALAVLPSGFRQDIEVNQGKIPQISLYVDARRDSVTDQFAVQAALDKWRAKINQQRFPAMASPAQLATDFNISIRSLASNASRTGAALGLILPLELTLAILLLSLYSATELVTAERERGTLVLLAVAPPARRDILIGKTLVVLATVGIGSLLSVLVQFILLFAFVKSIGDMAGSYSLQLRLSGMLMMLPLALPLIIFLTSVSISVGAYVRNFQQAQSYASLLLLICLLPATAPVLSTSDYPPLIAVIPIANTALALRDALSGQLTVSFAFGVIASSCLYAAVSLFLATRLLDSEHSVFPQDEPLNAWRTSSRLLLLFVAGIFLAYFVIGQSVQSLDVLLGLLSSQSLIIALPVFFFLRWLRLPVKAVLSIRKPTSFLILPAAILLAPLTVLAACAIMAVQDVFLPAPRALNELLMQVLLPEGKPLWLVVSAVALAPAICEELLFRGCVQGILIRSLPPKVVLPITAVAFGLFHMSAFRVLPTSFLGLVLCLITYRFRSIYPSMLLHFCHNFLSIIIGVYHIDPLTWQNCAIAGVSGSIGLLLLWLALRADSQLANRQ